MPYTILIGRINIDSTKITVFLKQPNKKAADRETPIQSGQKAIKRARLYGRL